MHSSLVKVVSLFWINLIIISQTFAQVQEVWVQRFQSTPVDYNSYANAIAIDNLGNIYVAGYTSTQSTGDDILLIKYDPQGVELWKSTYNGPGNFFDKAYAITIDNQNNVYITGVSIGNGTASDYVTIKYNSAGMQQWVSRYNGTGNAADECQSIAVDTNGYVVVTGFSEGVGTFYDYTTLKYDSLGNELWAERYDAATNYDWAKKVKISTSGAIYVSGNSLVSGVGEVYQTLKYSSDGNLLWWKRFNSALFGTDQVLDMTIDSQENIYVTGQSDANSGTGFDFATIKYDSAGNQLWVARYNGGANLLDSPRSIKVDYQGNVYVAGISHDSNYYFYYVTIKYDSNGNQLWIKTYDSPGNNDDLLTSLEIDASLNVYITGSAIDSTGSSKDYYTIKYDSLGNELWNISYDGPAGQTDAPSSLVVDSTGYVYVTGYCIDTGNDVDIATIKYTQNPSGIDLPENPIIASDFEIFQNYPNPFNPSTIIRYDLFKELQIKLDVFNILGQKITTLVNEQLPAGSYNVKFKASNLPAGVYLYQFHAGNIKQIKKMIILR